MDELKQHLPKISFGTVILAFFLPFVLIKCGGEEIANLSGLQLITGAEITADSEFMEEAQRTESNIFAILSMAAAVIGLIVALVKMNKWKVIAFVASLVGLVSLLLLYNDVKVETTNNAEGLLTISLGFGFYLAFIAYLVNSIFLGMYAKDKQDPEPEVS